MMGLFEKFAFGRAPHFDTGVGGKLAAGYMVKCSFVCFKKCNIAITQAVR